MNSQEVIDLKKRYPAGTRLICEEMKDPIAPVPSGTVGTVAHVDDIGQIHMDWDNGRALALIPGQDSFRVMPSKQFFMPIMTMFRRDSWQDYEVMDPMDACEYLDSMNETLVVECRESLNLHRGLAPFLSEDGLEQKVYAVRLAFGMEKGKPGCIITCEFNQTLSKKETTSLLDEISGQFSDGWGSGFAEKNIKVYDGEIQIYLWNREKDNTITEIGETRRNGKMGKPPYQFIMSIGDWSEDGHGKSEDFLVTANKPVQNVREAHYLIKEKTDIDIESLCSEYEDNVVPDDIAEQLLERGFQLERLAGTWVLTPALMASLWAYLLCEADPELKLRIQEPPQIETLHFYGKDEKGRHISQVGYGLFTD